MGLLLVSAHTDKFPLIPSTKWISFTHRSQLSVLPVCSNKKHTKFFFERKKSMMSNQSAKTVSSGIFH